MPGLPATTPLVVGFDLDMTLIDTVPGFSATLRVLGAELGVEFPVAEMTARLGPPLDHLLSEHLAEEAVAPAGDRFRELYPDHAVAPVPVLPGAHEAIAAVRRQRGRVVVVTGKFPDNARRHVDHLALAAGAFSVSVLTGGCTREELVEAGTHVVLESLEDFPAWLDEHLLTTRLAALEADLRERGSV